MVRPERKNTKGALTLREPELEPLTRAQWAARFGGVPVAELWPSAGCRLDGNLVPHVHARHLPTSHPGFNIDPRTGRWLRDGVGA